MHNMYTEFCLYSLLALCNYMSYCQFLRSRESEVYLNDVSSWLNILHFANFKLCKFGKGLK